jgi:hypothetical protein
MSAAQAQFDFTASRPASSAGTNGTSGTDKADIVAKLRKLMNTNGRTEAERDSAEILAAAIAAKHGIDLQQVDLAGSRPNMVITERMVGQWFSMPKEASYASAVCVKYFEVSQITLIGYDGAKETFIGLDYHLDIAEQVFRFLIHEFRYRWNHGKGQLKNRNQFLYGMFIALLAKLNERFSGRATTPGVEISWKAKRDAYLREHHPNSTARQLATKQRDSRAISAGLAAGRDIEIRPAVKAGTTVKRGELAAGGERKLLTGGTSDKPTQKTTP